MVNEDQFGHHRALVVKQLILNTLRNIAPTDELYKSIFYPRQFDLLFGYKVNLDWNLNIGIRLGGSESTELRKRSYRSYEVLNEEDVPVLQILSFLRALSSMQTVQKMTYGGVLYEELSDEMVIKNQIIVFDEGLLDDFETLLNIGGS